MPMMKAETSPGAPGACASHHHHQVGSPVNSTKSRRSLKFINLPSGTLALLATIGFLSLNYHCLSVEGYEHHRWRHRDRGSISHLPHHLPLAPIGIGPLSTAPASVATTAEETNRSQGENEEEESEEEEEEDLAPDYSSGSSSSLGFGLCSRCPPGFGVARRCTLVQDTVCHSCPPSYYAPSYSRRHACWPCSKCGEGLYEVQPCTGTSDTVCQACLHPPHLAGTDKSPINGNMHLCGHHHHHHQQQHHRGNINNGGGPSSSSSQQQRNLLSTLTIGDSNKNKRTTSGNLIHFLNHPAGGSPAAGAITNNNNNSSSKNEPPTTLGSFPSEINAETSSAEEDEVALGVAQLAAFQVVLIFTAVAAILALTCRLRVFSSHEPARLKLTETYRDDGVALIEQLSES
ncbi:uncharacterized protein LOC124350668 [Daphnia pulicaria]|uniref:uncharacterized protein LOC124350668 n=1 Tax=Daphnia pulicaria TaxID=35523 RepID=UPI001EEBB4E4|nr:uncharacterized protein LOC124350668 [Daphnia pulicaria]